MIRSAVVALAVLASSSAMAQQDEHHRMVMLMHNGSLMIGEVQGLNLTIRYEEPRQGLREAGIRSGTTLVTGILAPDGSISATSRLFRQGCKPAEFDVVGRLDGDRLTMRGIEPRWRKDARCEVNRNVPPTDLDFTGRPDQLARMAYTPDEGDWDYQRWTSQAETIIGSATIPAEAPEPAPVVAVVPPAPAPVVAAPTAQAAASSSVAVVVNVAPAPAPLPAPEPLPAPVAQPVQVEAPAPAKPKLDLDF
ncbi:hypothetical protein [Aureimonas phyllosphaerae]|uniref:Uncharacterized protein n=1 Tax=Aureimonas phyllosphaerae TaxID=1166078 RepID=A0A7W6FW92_9HYPH|nr:hypothetical protein [Aureimonas phyllosphaerae]MBB3938084.1 hypothetical protein [Aureimonas phyllosphaerae]MBB3962091.1 hypothetical protein [Aureimonas phyllosphaerae]SFF56053.1 hypothetical protein SAMN05216566_12837 [Aureimonas phyllosphaerae]